MAKVKNTSAKSREKLFSRELFFVRYNNMTASLARRPFTSLLIVLGLLFVTIIVGNIFNKPVATPTASTPAKVVSVYTIGESPTASFQAKIDKSGVVKIVALSSEIVESIFVSEGDTVYQGQQLFTLSTNYQGGNVPLLQSQIADAQYKNVSDTVSEQQSMIQKQRDLANINHDNFTDMQNIATASANDTSNLINANQTILDQLNQQLSDMQNSGASQSAILAQEGQINQLQSGQNQLRQSLRSLQEQTDGTKPPGRLADTQRDLTMQQLDIQEKSLELNLEISKLQANIADVMAATMFPSSPFTGTVERVYVRVGQQVNPGTVLAEIVSPTSQVSAIVDVPQEIAAKVSSLDTSTVFINNVQYAVRPSFIPTEATNGSLYSVIYHLPNVNSASLADGQYVRIDIPLGSPSTSAAVPFVPLDAIYQTDNANYLFLITHNKAIVQQVSIGNVFGNFAEITKGLHKGDEIILNRNVIAGDKVTIN